LSVERFDVLMKGFPLWEKQDKSLGLCLLWWAYRSRSDTQWGHSDFRKFRACARRAL